MLLIRHAPTHPGIWPFPAACTQFHSSNRLCSPLDSERSHLSPRHRSPADLIPPNRGGVALICSKSWTSQCKAPSNTAFRASITAVRDQLRALPNFDGGGRGRRVRPRPLSSRPAEAAGKAVDVWEGRCSNRAAILALGAYRLTGQPLCAIRLALRFDLV